VTPAHQNGSHLASMTTSDQQYTVSKPGAMAGRVARRQRQLMFDAFMELSGIVPADRVLDVGVTSDRSHEHSNYFEAWYPHKSRITAVGVEEASFLETQFPGVRYVRASGLELPMDDGSLDFVHSSAVIEHVGSYDNQIKFLGELWRVARKGIFVTTPNRWFPIEVHTVLPLIHYLPPATFRRILQLLGQDFFANEANLNLLSRSTLGAAARAAGMENFRIEHVSLLGWPSNLMLIGNKAIRQ